MPNGPRRSKRTPPDIRLHNVLTAWSGDCSEDGVTLNRHVSEFQRILRNVRPNLAFTYNSNEGETLLHLACKIRSSFPFVRLLVADNADDIDPNVLDCNGATPLHALAGNGHKSSLESFDYLLKQGAKLDHRNSNGKTPFNAIAHGQINKQEALLRFYANQIFLRSKQNALLWLLKAASHSPTKKQNEVRLPIGRLSVEEFKTLLSFLLDLQQQDLPAAESMLAVRDAEGDGDLPLHTVLRHGQSQVVTLLATFIYRKYPEASNIQNKNGDLPIHIAVHRFGITQVFSSFRHEWAHVPNNNGDLPIHVLLQHFISIQKPRFCTSPKTNCDLSPMQLSVRRGAEVSLERDLSRLLWHNDQNAATLRMANAQSRLPMHLACYGGVSRSILEFLITAERKIEGSEGQQLYSLSARDENGFLPLHTLCDSGAASLRALQYLIQAYPASVQMQTLQGDYPVTLACPTATLDMVYTLLRAHPAIVQVPQPVTRPRNEG